MMSTLADLERAEQYLDPLHTEANGVERDFCQVTDREQPPLRVAYRTYQPSELQSVVTGPAVLFVHDAHQSGQVYDEAAHHLAEHGIFAIALSLGWHGYGRWHSFDPWPQEHLTLARYVHHIHLVAEALPVERRRLILVGGGVLGSLLAQHYASDHELAGIALLGGCLPHLAAATWTAEGTGRSRWRQKQARASLALVSPPNQERIRAHWLGYAGVSDAEVFALWQYLSAESPQVRQAYEDLAGIPHPVPSVPTLVMAGERDAVIPRALFEQTASAYSVQPAIVPDAPHLLVRSAERHLVVERLAAFCQATGSVPS